MTQPEPPAGAAPAAAPVPAPELVPAKFNERFIAYVMDSMPFFVGFFATVYFLKSRGGFFTATPNWEFQVGAAWGAAVWIYQLIGNITGGTVGKRFMAIRVVNRDGRPLGGLRSAVRASGYFLSTPLNFGFLIALIHPETRTLHDILSGSLVVDSREKNKAETGILFAGAVLLVIAMYAGTITITLTRPTPRDLLAIERAREGLNILAQIEEAYKAEHGVYTRSLQELAVASGDVEEFKSAMNELFDPKLYKIEATRKKYRISAAAKDKGKTRVMIEGP